MRNVDYCFVVSENHYTFAARKNRSLKSRAVPDYGIQTGTVKKRQGRKIGIC